MIVAFHNAFVINYRKDTAIITFRVGYFTFYGVIFVEN